LFGSPKNNLMGPFGKVRGMFCVCWDALDHKTSHMGKCSEIVIYTSSKS